MRQWGRNPDPRGRSPSSASTGRVLLRVGLLLHTGQGEQVFGNPQFVPCWFTGDSLSQEMAPSLVNFTRESRSGVPVDAAVSVSRFKGWKLLSSYFD